MVAITAAAAAVADDDDYFSSMFHKYIAICSLSAAVAIKQSIEPGAFMKIFAVFFSLSSF